MIKTTEDIIKDKEFDNGIYENRVWFDSEHVLDLLCSNMYNNVSDVISIVEKRIVEKIGEKGKDE